MFHPHADLHSSRVSNSCHPVTLPDNLSQAPRSARTVPAPSARTKQGANRISGLVTRDSAQRRPIASIGRMRVAFLHTIWRLAPHQPWPGAAVPCPDLPSIARAPGLPVARKRRFPQDPHGDLHRIRAPRSPRFRERDPSTEEAPRQRRPRHTEPPAGGIRVGLTEPVGLPRNRPPRPAPGSRANLFSGWLTMFAGCSESCAGSRTRGGDCDRVGAWWRRRGRRCGNG